MSSEGDKTVPQNKYTVCEPSENMAIDRPSRLYCGRSTILRVDSYQFCTLHTLQRTLFAPEWRIHQRLMIGYRISACERAQDCPRLFFAPWQAARIICIFTKRAFAQLRDTLSNNVLNCFCGFLPDTHFVYKPEKAR